MATQVLTDIKLYVAQYDLSARTNRCTLAQEIETLDTTTFGTSGTRSFRAGLQAIAGQHSGLWSSEDANDIDAVIFNRIGQNNILHTLAMPDGVQGDIGYSFVAAGSRYTPGASVGELMAFDFEFAGAGAALYRGTIMQSSTELETATGTGTARQLGAVGATESVISALHCTEFTGTSLDVTVVSDDGAGMASPTTRITHTQLTDVGSELLTAAGPITDDWWRVDFTFVGTSFRLAVNVAIQ